MVIIITKYFIIGRVIYQIIPFLILFSYIGYYQFFARYEKKFIFLSPFIIILFLASILVILKLEVSDNHSVLFKKSAKYFYDLEIKNKCILARDGKLEYYLPNNNIIVIGREKYAKKECNPEYILLSNLSHIALWKITNLEKENFNKTNIILDNNFYNLEKIFKKDNYFVKIYKRK